MPIIKDQKLSNDTYTRALSGDDVEAADVTLVDGNQLVSLDVWKARRDELIASNAKIGVLLRGDEQLDEITDDLEEFSLIALDFPHFKDGRSFSKSRLLREKFGFEGEIRAVGDVQYDQLFFMHRVGFTAYELAPSFDIEEALNAFGKYSVRYQPGTDEENPLYRQVKR